MDHNPPTMGDLAYGEAQRNQSELSYLRARVDELEKWREEVIEWSKAIADELNELKSRSSEPCACQRRY